MSLESGGYAEKLGNRYEGRWVVRQMLYALGGRIRTVTLEAVGDDEKGVDLWVELNDGKRDGQQCKASLGTKNHWSMADLHSKGILDHLRFQIERDGKQNFTLISAVHARSLLDLTRRAKQSTGSATEFYEHQVLPNQENAKEFHAFCRYLQFDWTKEEGLQNAYKLLQNSDFHLFMGDAQDAIFLEELASHYVNADPSIVIAVLADFAEDNLHKTLTADDISRQLISKGFKLRELPLDDRLVTRIGELRSYFRQTFSGQLAGGSLISRKSASDVLSKIEGINCSKIVVVHGRAGFGKSGVLLELTSLLDQIGIPYLPFRLDRQSPSGSPKHFGEKWDLPDSPSMCLSQLVGEKPAILILDQIDAMRWTSGHSSDAWQTCQTMIRQAMRLGNVKVVIACRTFDLENDPQFVAWAKAHELEKIEVSDLDDSVVRRLVGELYESLNLRQQKLLRSVQNLSLWLELSSKSHAPTGFVSSADLMRKFWDNRYEELARRNVPSEETNGLISSMIDYFSRYGVLSVPYRLIQVFQRAALELQSLSVIRVTQNSVSFCHQSYYDYLLACRIADEIKSGKNSIFEWLGDKTQQSLFRREQLRVLLLLMREENPDRYVETIRALLESNVIRFHLKHLCLQVLGQADVPTEEEVELALRLADDSFWREHVASQVFWQNAAWFYVEGVKQKLREWLSGGNDVLIDHAFWLLRSIDTKCGELVAELLIPFENESDKKWVKRIDWIFIRSPQDDSDGLFEMRLRLIRNNRTHDYLDWNKFAASTPDRCLPLLAASLEGILYKEKHPKEHSDEPAERKRPASMLDLVNPKELEVLLSSAKSNPAYVWEVMVPLFEQLLKNRQHHLKKEAKRYYVSRRLPRYFATVRKIISAAGQVLAKQDFDAFSSTLIRFSRMRSKFVQRIAINCMTSAAEAVSDQILRWLLEHRQRFQLGRKTTPNRFVPARRLIKRFARTCSESIYCELEEFILGFHPKEEWKSISRRHQENMSGLCKDYGQPNEYGLAHYFLLSALPCHRRSTNARQAVGIAMEKFRKIYPRYREPRQQRCGGTVISPVPANKLNLVSDNVWLFIIETYAKTRTHEKWRQLDEENVAESSAETFSQSLGQISKRQPRRFARLALKIPKDTSPLYLQEIMQSFQVTAAPEDSTVQESLAWEPALAAEIEAVFQHAQKHGHAGLEHSLCYIVRNRPDTGWTEWAIGEVCRLACTHPEPTECELAFVKEWSARTIEDLEITAMNYVRGPAAQAIHSLLHSNPERLKDLRRTIETLLLDPHPSVRIAATGICLPAWFIDHQLAVDWFLTICDCDDDRVLASRNAIRFVNYAQREFLGCLEPLINRMINSDVAEVHEHGAARATFVWLNYQQMEDLYNRCLTGTDLHKIGVAAVAANCTVNPTCGDRGKAILLKLSNDPDLKVREKAGSVFLKTDIFDKLNSPQFVIDFTKTQAFRDDPTELIFPLEDYKGNLLDYRDVIMTICNALTDEDISDSRSDASHLSYKTDKIPALLLRLYEQAQGKDAAKVQDCCLDNWDRLLERRVGSVRGLIEKIDI